MLMKRQIHLTKLHIIKPIIALNKETYISLRHQELRHCKNIGYEFYSEELFVVKYNSRYSFESTIYFNLSPKVIKETCNVDCYFNNSNIKPAVLDSRNELVLAN